MVLTNSGKTSITLWRGPHLRGEIRLRRMPSSEKPGAPEVTFHTPFTVTSTDPHTAPQFSDRDFVTLDPGESFKEPFEFSFPFPTSSNKEPAIQPRDGVYETSVQVALWIEGAGILGSKISPISIARGSVWAREILVHVDEGAKLENCSLK